MRLRHRIRRNAGILLILPISLAACGGRTAGSALGTTTPSSSGNVITTQEIEARGVTVNTMRDLLIMLPGVVATGNGIQITGRGVPLFVVNSVPMSDPSAALSLNPRDVERVEVVKDAGETAQYGFRGGNGIILITTRQ